MTCIRCKPPRMQSAYVTSEQTQTNNKTTGPEEECGVHGADHQRLQRPRQWSPQCVVELGTEVRCVLSPALSAWMRSVSAAGPSGLLLLCGRLHPASQCEKRYRYNASSLPGFEFGCARELHEREGWESAAVKGVSPQDPCLPPAGPGLVDGTRQGLGHYAKQSTALVEMRQNHTRQLAVDNNDPFKGVRQPNWRVEAQFCLYIRDLAGHPFHLSMMWWRQQP